VKPGKPSNCGIGLAGSIHDIAAGAGIDIDRRLRRPPLSRAVPPEIPDGDTRMALIGGIQLDDCRVINFRLEMAAMVARNGTNAPEAAWRVDKFVL
jgi:hypothetical protein